MNVDGGPFFFTKGDIVAVHLLKWGQQLIVDARDTVLRTA